MRSDGVTRLDLWFAGRDPLVAPEGKRSTDRCLCDSCENIQIRFTATPIPRHKAVTA